MNATPCTPSRLAYTDPRGVETSRADTAPVRLADFLCLSSMALLRLPARSMVGRVGKYPIPDAVLVRFRTSRPPITGHRLNFEKSRGGHHGQ